MTNEELAEEIRQLKLTINILYKRLDTIVESQKITDQRHKFLEETSALNFKLGQAAHSGNTSLMKMYEGLKEYITNNHNSIFEVSANLHTMALETKKFLDALQGNKEKINLTIVKEA